MTGLGDYEALSQDDLKGAFDAARGAGARYLIVHAYNTATPHYIVGAHKVAVCDVLGTREEAVGASEKGLVDTLVEIYDRRGSLNIRAVYDLRRDFHEAQGDHTLLPKGAYKATLGAIQQLEALRDRRQQSLWARILAFVKNS